MRALAIAVALSLVGCGGEDARFAVHVPADLDPGAQPAIDDLISDLSRVTGERFVERDLEDDNGCRDGEIHIVYRGRTNGLAGQEYRVVETRCGEGGHHVELSGGSLMSGQWAAYDLMHRIGVRYFHPEQTLYPSSPRWPAEPIDAREKPSFINRSLHIPRERPMELSSPLWPMTVNMANHQRRWIDWNIKQRYNRVDGYDVQLVDDYAYQRGFGRTSRLGLLTSPDGDPALDPSDSRPETVQISEAMQLRLEPVEDVPDPVRMEIDFAGADLTTADDVLTVQRLTFAAEYARDTYPAVELYAINHGIHQDPTPNYMVRYFDLPRFAPAQLGGMVRPLMFYDLERGAAGVYGNTDFRHLRDWALAEQSTRRIVHAPQASWWRTFDIAVPLYLAPVTLEARQHDIDMLAPYLQSDPGEATGVWGHRMYSGGQEWGYWLIDYCVARMTWSTAITQSDCLDDFTAQLGDGDEIRAVLAEVTARQVDDLRDPERLRFLVGSDGSTEPRHPMAPSPAEVLGWSDQQVEDLANLSLTPLAQMAADYRRWADRVEATLPMQSAAQGSWVREIGDGLRIFALRAEHALEVYTTVLALRAALAAGDNAAIDKAREGVGRAKILTEQARALVVAREADYRYNPELTIDGDEEGSPGAVRNAAGYSYRYLSRTHRVYYWTRVDEQLEALFTDL
jgi:hypothetical protein